MELAIASNFQSGLGGPPTELRVLSASTLDYALCKVLGGQLQDTHTTAQSLRGGRPKKMKLSRVSCMEPPGEWTKGKGKKERKERGRNQGGHPAVSVTLQHLSVVSISDLKRNSQSQSQQISLEF